jgi:hypothetical protein
LRFLPLLPLFPSPPSPSASLPFFFPKCHMVYGMRHTVCGTRYTVLTSDPPTSGLSAPSDFFAPDL